MRPWSTSGRLLPGLTAQRLSTQGPAVQLLLKTTNAETADNAGTPQSKLLVMENIKKFPRGISDQTISASGSYGLTKRVRPGPGLMKSQATSKPQAPSVKLSNQPEQASSDKRQAPSNKLQAASHKRQAP